MIALSILGHLRTPLSSFITFSTSDCKIHSPDTPNPWRLLTSFLALLNMCLNNQEAALPERALATACAVASSLTSYFQIRDNHIHSPFPSAGEYAGQIFKSRVSWVMVTLWRTLVETVFCRTCSKRNHRKHFPRIIFLLVAHCFLPLVIFPQDGKEHEDGETRFLTSSVYMVQCSRGRLSRKHRSTAQTYYYTEKSLGSKE